MQNTLVKGASVCSSCVLNAKRGSILQTVIDCLYVKLLMLCVWQYSVVLPGSCLEMCKSRVSWTGLWLLVAPRCSTCPDCPPSALCQAAMLWPPPPPDPVASTPSGTQRPSNLFLCKRLEAGACQTSYGNCLFPELGILKACIPDPSSHLAAWTLLKLQSKHFYWSAFTPLCADRTSVQLILRVGELKIQSVKCSSPWLSFWLWEQCLAFKGHVHNLSTDLMPNKPNWKETG